MALPKWMQDVKDAAARAGARNRAHPERLYQGTDEIVPGIRAAPLHRDPGPVTEPDEAAPLDTDPDPPQDGGPRD